MNKQQTLEQWLAAEKQKQEARNSEFNKEELIAQINQLNFELAQEKKVSQTWEEKWKKAEKELEKEWVTVLTNYRNWNDNRERNDKLVDMLIISVSVLIGCIYYFEQKENKKKIKGDS